MIDLTNTTMSNPLFNLSNGSFYNTGCIDEINSIIHECNNFHDKIIGVMNGNFKIMIIAIFIICFYEFVIAEIIFFKMPFGSRPDWYYKWVRSKIELCLLLLSSILFLSYFFI